MLRVLKGAVIIVCLALTSLASGYDEAAAGVATPAGVVPATAISAASIRSIHWVRHCHCWRHWKRTSRRSWVVRARYPQWGSCWQWRATHWGIGRVWNCYYIY
jgi:hypothetical protein